MPPGLSNLRIVWGELCVTAVQNACMTCILSSNYRQW